MELDIPSWRQKREAADEEDELSGLKQPPIKSPRKQETASASARQLPAHLKKEGGRSRASASGPARSGQHRGGGGDTAVGYESELALATADLCLEVKAATREVQGYSEMTVLVPCSSPLLIEGLEAGVNHNKLIKERKGENVGSPHGKVAEASLRGLATIPQIKGTKLENSLSKFWTEVVMKEDSKLLESEVQVFRATKPKVPSKKTFAFGEEPYGRIVFRFAPMRPSSSLAASVEEDLISFCKTMNWEVMVGTAPRSLKERRLAELKAMASR